MKILVTGKRGQVGHALQQALSNAHDVLALDREEMDLSQPEQIRYVIAKTRPALIINPAAYTAVDKAESEPEMAHAINALAPKVIAEEAAKLGAGLIHFSTDYVYQGNKASPYIETDDVNPLSVYGKTKLAGEQAIQAVGLPHLILRTSWVYGAHGKNFLKTILRLSAERDHLKIVSDQWGAPTSSTAIAHAVSQLLTHWTMSDQTQSGIYHFTNAGSTSWYGFAKAILQAYASQTVQCGLPALKIGSDAIIPITTAEYPTPAARPANSRLDNTKLHNTFGVDLPAWETSLHAVMLQIKHFD